MLNLETLGLQEVGSKPEVDVTPEKAKEFLTTYNFGNRGLSEDLVSQYTRLMKNDAWSHVTELSFDTNNRLIDGQHRLSAVVRSNRPQRFSLNLHCPPEAQRDIDTGKLRSTKDTLDMMGATYTALMASILMLYRDWQFEGLTKYTVNYGGQAKTRLSRSEKNDYVAQMYKEHGELINEVCRLGNNMNALNNGAVLNKSAVGAAALAASDAMRLEEFKEFIMQVATGEGLIRHTAQHAMSGSLSKISMRHPLSLIHISEPTRPY